MNSEPPTRDELKRRLKDKIRSKRSNDHTGPQLVQRLQDDPATALMSMGIDDASVLNNAKQIIQMSKSMLNKSTKKRTKEARDGTSNNTVNTMKMEQIDNTCDDSEEEEAPPPPLTS